MLNDLRVKRVHPTWTDDCPLRLATEGETIYTSNVRLVDSREFRFVGSFISQTQRRARAGNKLNLASSDFAPLLCGAKQLPEPARRVVGSNPREAA